MDARYGQRLRELEERGQLRRFRPLEQLDGCRVRYQGRTFVNVTSNDYLGLAGDRQLHREFYAGLDEESLLSGYGLGAASSRLLTGDNPTAHELEEHLRQAYGRPGCLLFNSGYHANIGILPALAGKGDLVLSDKLNHASIHDGLLLSRAEHKRFRHADYDHLAAILDRERSNYDRVIIASESVFSMDGDVADLGRLVALKNRYDCLLYIDEAHSIGVYGKNGLGMAEEHGLIAAIDLLVGTFGKACASVGAFLVSSETVCDYLINHSRSLIFTTALPPVVMRWNLFVCRRLAGLSARREHLARLSGRLRDELQRLELPTAGSTNIVPVIIGANDRCLALAAKMQEKGFLIFAVRPPTVPRGTSRFRLSLTADMEWEDIKDLPELIAAGMAAA